jgi:hypothetical protein
MARHDKPAAMFASWDSGVQLLSWLATCASVLSFLFYAKSGDVLLYGDAVAHINIARRVFDSKTPGLLQLGTVWLPLPHLLMVPFLVSNDWWQRGLGGSIPSMAAYVFAIVGVFRLTRDALSGQAKPDAAARGAAWTAAVVFAANPNLIYMQSTAMGEADYLAFFIWTVVFFARRAHDQKALTKCGLCVMAACLTRYDGWFLAALLAGVVIAEALVAKSAAGRTHTGGGLRTKAAQFALLAAAGPVLWLAYNGIVYRNPLEFENGPYSAKAIEQRTHAAGNPAHPGSRNPFLAGLYFFKSAEDNLAENDWLERGWVLIAMAGVIAAFVPGRRKSNAPQDIVGRRAWPLLLLLVPLPFYALSVAYGGVPIFVPNWWPFSHYNVRYGLQLLPAFSIAVSIPVGLAVRYVHWNRRVRVACALLPLALVLSSYVSIWRATPICLSEAQVNMRTRNQLEIQLATWLVRLPSHATILMYLGDHVGALERAGIPLSHTINEGNHRVWKQPDDPDGLWERALRNPPQYADYIVAFEGDPVWKAVHRQDFNLAGIVEIHVSGQARGVLYGRGNHGG